MSIVSQNGRDPTADDLKARVDLRDLVEELWGPPKHRYPRCLMYYARWRSPEDHASFAVFDNGFKDYGNGDHGDHFDLLIREGMVADFPEAKRWLINYAEGRGMSTLPATQVQHRPPTNEAPPIHWQQASEKALAWTQDFLWSDDPLAIQVRDYLHTVRGLNDDTIRHFQLGFNSKPLETEYEDENGHKNWLRPGVVIPIYNGGVLWALRVRCIVGNLAAHLGRDPDTHRSGEPVEKYMNLAGSKLTGTLFNGDAIDPDKNVVTTEGEFDAMLVQQILGDSVTVVSLGPASNKLSNRWRNVLEAVEDIYIIPDQDKEGQAAGEALAESLGAKAHLLKLPVGKDVTEFVVEHHRHFETWFYGRICWFPNGVPDTWRSAMLKYMHPATALTLELFNEAARDGLLDSQAFTIKDLLYANEILPNFSLAKSTLHREFSSLEGVFFSKLDTVVMGTTVSNSENNSAGRKPDTYAMMTYRDAQANLVLWAEPRIVEKRFPTKGNEQNLISITGDMLDAIGIRTGKGEIISQLKFIDRALDISPDRNWSYWRTERDLKKFKEGLNDHLSTPLPEDAVLHNSSGYRDAFLEVTIAAGPEEGVPLSRHGIRNLLGIANGTVTSVLNRVGVESEAQFTTVPFDPTRTLERQLDEQGREVKGFALELVAEVPGEEPLTCSIQNMDRCQAMIQECLASGNALEIKFQTASRRRLGEPMMSLPKSPSRRGRSAPVKAEQSSRKKPFYGTGYDPEWVKDQLVLRLKALLWQERRDGTWVHQGTGEVIDMPDTPEALVECLLKIAKDIEDHGASFWMR